VTTLFFANPPPSPQLFASLLLSLFAETGFEYEVIEDQSSPDAHKAPKNYSDNFKFKTPEDDVEW
jgi:hypothetical protein